MRLWSLLLGAALLVTGSGFGAALWVVLRWEVEAPLWQVGLASCFLCIPCCIVAGLLAILGGILDMELTPKAFACDMLPEDSESARELHLV
mmetsp:Transcript_41686/g.134792  ORF Transcript_41686/g.134792 Transcript_41686/m.134792 type:complete len:91 (+) Transcript_41686:76-348(+)